MHKCIQHTHSYIHKGRYTKVQDSYQNVNIKSYLTLGGEFAKFLFFSSYFSTMNTYYRYSERKL